MLTSIVVPVDTSNFAEGALPIAEAIAQRHGATLHLVSVFQSLKWDITLDLPLSPLDGLRPVVVEKQTAYVRELAGRVIERSRLPVRWALLQGHAADAIDAYVRTNAVELIVMTTHARSGLQRAILGSTADALLRISSVPILLLHTPLPSPAPLRSVVAAMDGSAAAEHALEMAASLQEHGRGTLLHVIEPPFQYPSHFVPDARELERADTEQRRSASTAYLARILMRIRPLWPDVDGRVLVSEDVPGTLLREANQEKADLLVLGTHGSRPLRRALLGSVADKVIRSARIPVLVAPPAVWPD